MRTKRTAFLVSAIIFGLLCWVVVRAADTELFKTRVIVKVSANDSVKTEFESYIKRELRGLNDVEVVEDSPDYNLSFVVIETQSKGGTSTGYIISEVVTHRLSQKGLEIMFKQKLSQEDLTWIGKATQSAVVMDRHSLQTCAPNDMKPTCEKIIAEFDTDMLEPGRKFARQVQEMIETSQKKPDNLNLYSQTNKPAK